MGIFNSKKMCGCCGEKCGIAKYQIGKNDEWICQKCYKQTVGKVEMSKVSIEQVKNIVFKSQVKQGTVQSVSNATYSEQKNKELHQSAVRSLEKFQPGWTEERENQVEQMKQHERGQTALKKLKQDKDFDKAIAIFEKIVEKEKTLFDNGVGSNTINLLDLYYKAQYYDRAWKYSNELIMDYAKTESSNWGIRYIQCKILKKEKRYKDAMEMLILAYAGKSFSYTDYGNSIQYSSEVFVASNKSKFIKEAMVLGNKLKYDCTKIEYLADFIEKSLGNSEYNEAYLVAGFREFLKEAE